MFLLLDKGELDFLVTPEALAILVTLEMLVTLALLGREAQGGMPE